MPGKAARIGHEDVDAALQLRGRRGRDGVERDGRGAGRAEGAVTGTRGALSRAEATTSSSELPPPPPPSHAPLPLEPAPPPPTPGPATLAGPTDGFQAEADQCLGSPADHTCWPSGQRLGIPHLPCSVSRETKAWHSNPSTPSFCFKMLSYSSVKARNINVSSKKPRPASAPALRRG